MELLGAVAGPVIGGLLGGGGNKSSQTQSNQIDPRLAEAIYGSNGSVPLAQQWLAANKTGMNSQMQQGLDNQTAQYAASKPGFDQMQNLGLGLMGGGVAGNPFSSGYTGGTNFAPTGMSNTAGKNQPIAQQTAQTYTPATFNTTQAQTPVSTPTAATSALNPELEDMLKRYRAQLGYENQFRANPGFEQR